MASVQIINGIFFFKGRHSDALELAELRQIPKPTNVAQNFCISIQFKQARGVTAAIVIISNCKINDVRLD